MLLKRLERLLRDQNLGFINQPELFPFANGGGEPTIDDEDFLVGAERSSVTFIVGAETGNVDFAGIN